jgi:plastocyanin
MPSEPGDVAGGRTVVDIRDLKFVPETVTIPAGTTVVFTNSDKVPHTLRKKSGPGPDFDSGPLNAGATFQQVFPEEGRIKITDPDRPETELTVIVEKNQ